MVADFLSSSWLKDFRFNWFDLGLVLFLAFGFWRGRKRGMTKELLPTLQWLAILLGAGFGHVVLAKWLQQQGLIKQVFHNRFDERTAALLSSYLAIALVICAIFSALKRKYNAKLEGSSVFGGNEYYWGVGAGLIRYICLVLVGLALLNAPYYSAHEIAVIKQEKLNTYAAGGGVKELQNDSGDFIPSVYQVQDVVFKNSFVGPYIKKDLAMLLINTMDATKKTAHT
jgi:uncharacterized membrane protein required for colicin V production